MDGPDEHIQRQPLSQEIRDAQLARLILQFLRRAATQHNHPGTGVMRSDLLEHRQTVHFRHAQIEQGHQRAKLLK